MLFVVMLLASQAPVFPPDQDVTLPGLVDVGAKLPVHVELKYATADNFMKRDVYGGLKRCFLVGEAEAMLKTALDALKQKSPGLTFVVYDCARPLRVQKIMWSIVEGTTKEGYVANPYKQPGSVHNTGCAVIWAPRSEWIVRWPGSTRWRSHVSRRSASAMEPSSRRAMVQPTTKRLKRSSTT